MKLLEKILSSHDNAYNHRKVENSEDIIKVAKHMGMTYQQIAEICSVSKTMVSHWGNIHKSDKPTLKQVTPLLEYCGKGRFKLELEPLSEAAISYPPRTELYKSGAVFFGMICPLSIFILWFFGTACDNFPADSQCHNETWYDKPFYELKLMSMGRIKFEDIKSNELKNE